MNIKLKFLSLDLLFSDLGWVVTDLLFKGISKEAGRDVQTRELEEE